MKIIDKMKLTFNKIDKQKSIIFSLPILFFLIISFMVVLADPVPVREVTITSNYSGAGAWTINKRAEWIAENKARVTLELDSQTKLSNRNKDVILVIDVSGSMEGTKLSRVKEDAKDLIDTLLVDSNNSIAIVSFSDSATKLSDLTNNASTLDSIIDNLNADGDTNYNAGLKMAKGIIENYTQVNNRDIILLFLTDGRPNKSTPNQVATYEIIKEQYPFVDINAIQYEMGKDIVQDVIDISDNQFVASGSTLNNVLFEASVSPLMFDSFKVEDYIGEDFELDSISNVNSSIGTVNLTTESNLQKITWNLGNSYRTGTKQTITIDINLKSENQILDSLFDTNDQEIITSKLPDDTQKVVNSSLTPILANKYTVVYQTNTPTGCTLSNIPNEKHSPYEVVTIRNDDLLCNGYAFKGFKLVDDTVTMINSNSFIMPGNDVILRGVWSKLAISASMDGDVATGLTLYKVIKNEYKSNSGYAGKYTGEHKDSYNRIGLKDIYYYTTPTANNTTEGNNLLDKVNVIFGDFCWQMLRTTDTGGVKMIYNGVPLDGKCTNSTTRNINGLKQGARVSNVSMDASYAYGSDFTYDLDAKTYKIDGTIKENINYSSDKSVIGYYTCRNIDKNATCSTLYYLQEESDSNTNPYVYPFTIASTNYAQIGVTPYNTQKESMAYVGYMYNKSYDGLTFVETTNQNYNDITNTFPIYTASLSTTYWYANSIDFGSSGYYQLVNPYQVTSTSDYPSLVGKYTFLNTSQTYQAITMCYIIGVTGNTAIYKILERYSITSSYYYGDTFDYGETTEGKYTITNATQWSNGIDVTGKYVASTDFGVKYVLGMNGDYIYYDSLMYANKVKLNDTIAFGSSITDNLDGTYSLNNYTMVSLADYYLNYANYENKYTCGDSSTTCKIPRYIKTTTNSTYTFYNATEKILISKTRSGLTLTDTLLVSVDELSKNYSNYSEYKYTCGNTNSTCTEDTLKMITEFFANRYTYAKNLYFGSSATWNGNNYILNNVIGIESATNTSDLSTHHYTCFDPVGTTCTSVGYITYYSGSGTMNYILLENGVETVETALSEMLYDNNVNKKDSAIKRLVDEWYYNNLYGFNENYLEETIYCNNRTISNYGAYNSSNGFGVSLSFDSTSDLSCTYETDRFSILNNKAKLKYNVGVASKAEMNLLNNSTVRKTGSDYWVLSPGHFGINGYNINSVRSTGVWYTYTGSSSYGVRPVVSINSTTLVDGGTGTMDNPYILDPNIPGI